jgi:hypothetical protein
VGLHLAGELGHVGGGVRQTGVAGSVHIWLVNSAMSVVVCARQVWRAAFTSGW